uniref:Uncharacterized protein n=1 Tax=Nelumbo nucifera TaxID=4432 RepID=A0A822XVL7_NELNU|nr:TPA_asm: hypothetical protein HUJ06_024674 [Nelumbo nucifera]
MTIATTTIKKMVHITKVVGGVFQEMRDYDCEGSGDDEQNSELVPCGEEEGIDLRAKVFIAKFYTQIGRGRRD